MAKDPVCGMNVDESTAKAKSEYKGTTYYFCAPGCKAAFDKNPEQYLAAPAAGRATGTEWAGTATVTMVAAAGAIEPVRAPVQTR